ncbi:hypothetical protein, partial [Mucilaginibacter lacusdianchii]|uniref:hypothetical protein n=1 Tax=Mucilaginibacter lacusdianchii TaxID=2684211 RepID=UPI00131E6D69
NCLSKAPSLTSHLPPRGCSQLLFRFLFQCTFPRRCGSAKVEKLFKAANFILKTSNFLCTWWFTPPIFLPLSELLPCIIRLQGFKGNNFAHFFTNLFAIILIFN